MSENPFSLASSSYAKHRPSYPDELFVYLASLVPHRRTAWDCATGTGQAATALATYFQKVYATDISAEQINAAPKLPNIDYSIQPAEKTNFSYGSMNIVTAAQALHWFKHNYFYREVHRVLQPGGIFAAWGYHFFKISPEIDTLFDKLIHTPLLSYWASETKLLWDNYRNVPFPFREIAAPKFSLSLTWNLDDLIEYLKTWSAMKKFIAAHGASPLPQFRQALSPIWGDPDERRPVFMELPLRVGRCA